MRARTQQTSISGAGDAGPALQPRRADKRASAQNQSSSAVAQAHVRRGQLLEDDYVGVVWLQGRSVFSVDGPSLQRVQLEILDWANRQGKQLNWSYDETMKTATRRGVETPVINAQNGALVPLRNGPPGPLRTLNAEESSLMFDCEAVVRRGLDTFLEVGSALVTIRDRRLYREHYHTFEEYCQRRWDMTARRARQLCAAADVVGNLKGPAGPPTSEQDGNNRSDPPVLPATESQARPLTQLKPLEQREAWQEAVKTAPGGKVTAKHVEEVVRRRTGKAAKAETQEPTRPDELEELTPRVNQPTKTLAAGSKTVKDVWLRAALEKSIADLQELVGLMGTPDSAEAAEVGGALVVLQRYRDHLDKLGRMQESRRDGRRVGERAPEPGPMGPLLASLRGRKRSEPKANQFGVFPDEMAEKIRFREKKLSACIKLLEVGGRWLCAVDFCYDGTGDDAGGNLSPLTAKDGFKTRDMAIQAAVERVIEVAEHKGGAGWHTPEGKRAAAKLLAWAGELKKVDEERWVICREPLKGATRPDAAAPRYAGNPGGWTPDPSKVTPFTDRTEAVVKAAQHNDKVMTLAKAQRRYQHGL